MPNVHINIYGSRENTLHKIIQERLYGRKRLYFCNFYYNEVMKQ